ncbi:MAG TPA: DUF2200 domain-containing protein [Bryobacteraceae bacterium]|nr:DUF2200 domain-containing protein [Bryobacteraceae bacterium]
MPWLRDSIGIGYSTGRQVPRIAHLILPAPQFPFRRRTWSGFGIIGGMDNTRIFRMAFASVYPHYIAKAERKGRSKEEVDAIIYWLTGYDEHTLQQQIGRKVDFETFFSQAPRINPNASRITGVICGYRVEEIEDTLMRQIRYLDKLVDELAKGKAMDKILRK